MNTRTYAFFALLAVLLVSTPVLAQDAAAPEVTFKSTELAPGLYMLEGVGGFGGGNVGLLTGDDGVVLVDDSFPPHTQTLLGAVAQVVSEPIDFVINTHVHGDHAGGNAILSGKGATLVAHDNVRARLVANGTPTPEGNVPAPKAMLPVLTFNDALTFHLNGQESHVFHVAQAHTDGDAVIHFRTANVIHAGDVFFNGIFPFIDLDNGGSVDGYIAAQKKILELAGADGKIIPGHGPLATPADLRASIDMLETAKKNIGALLAEGKSLDDIIAANPLADFASQDWQFITTERMIRQVHRDLTSQ